MPTSALSVAFVTVLGLVCLFILSFDALEYQEMGLNYSWVWERVDRESFGSGRYYLGIGNHFIKFPKMVKSVYLLQGGEARPVQPLPAAYRQKASWGNQVNRKFEDFNGPALQSRTADGLDVRLEISFQYRLKFDRLYDLFTTLGHKYQDTLVRMAIEQLSTSTTRHPAHFFFTNRTTIGREMHKELRDHFEKHAFSEVPFFQLRTVHLPKAFEDAIKRTQVKQQEIEIARLEQQRHTVGFETRVLQAEQRALVLQKQAAAEVEAIQLHNDAYCRQYELTNGLQASALDQLQTTAEWNSPQLLNYLRIRAVREHPSNKTTIRI